jgi:hypothetical protein
VIVEVQGHGVEPRGEHWVRWEAVSGGRPWDHWRNLEQAAQVRFGTVQGFKGLEADAVVYLAPQDWKA